MTRTIRLTRLLLLPLLAAWALALPAGAQGTFTKVGETAVERNLPQVALLADGRVLVTGGTRTSGDTSAVNREAEIYDPATESFTPTGSMAAPRLDHAIVTLPNGRVLLIGGTSDGRTALNSSETFDPAAGIFRVTATMALPRIGATATLLQDGRVLVVGGTFRQGDDDFVVLGAEVYDPAVDRFSPSGRLERIRVLHSAVALPDGRVLILGGLGQDPLGPGAIMVREVEIFDPATGAFTTIGQLSEGRIAPRVTLLPDGKVLVSGGVAVNAEQQAIISNTLEVFDPATGSSSEPRPMTQARRLHVAVALADGRVLLAGGTTGKGNAQTTPSAELFDPATGQSSAIGALTEPRTQAGAVRLGDGSVLIVGGARLEDGRVAARLKTAEVYRP